MFGWLGGIGMAFLAYSVFLRETEGGVGAFWRPPDTVITASPLSDVCWHVGFVAWHPSPVNVLHMPPVPTNQNQPDFF